MTEHEPHPDPRMEAAWQRVTATGWAFVAIGLIAILLPNAATIAVEVFIAWFLTLAGGAGLIAWWRLEGESQRWQIGAAAALALIIGVWFLMRPGTGMRVLTVILALVFLLEGFLIVSTALGLKDRVSNWGWMLISGLTSLTVGGLIMAGWPGTSAWAIGLLFGINLMTSGVSLISISARQAL